MNGEILLTLGGVGLFLLGMLVLTDGLRGLAGHALRRTLATFTHSPMSGAVTGALTTALVQSSSAVTVTTVGFVSAGLLTFPQALGVILGANIGTTTTGWLVAIVGFKLDLGTVVLPLVLVGVLLRLFAGGRLRHLGWALAGFSLLFIGIDVLQEGMALLEGRVTPDSFPEDSMLGRFQLLLIGVAITLVTQSSSAGVATALVALDAGAITFMQGAAMVIGMNVGTTFTAVLATIGGSTAARQAGFAHVIYNVLIGLMAFFLLTPFAVLVTWLTGGGAAEHGQISLVAFHTTFNLVGVILVLPVARPFARLVMWLVPGRGPRFLQRLDDRLLQDPAAASDAAAATIRELSDELFAIIVAFLDPHTQLIADAGRLREVEQALSATRDFTERIHAEPDRPHVHRRQIAALHALDHLGRLCNRCAQTERISALGRDARLRRLTAVLCGVMKNLPDSADTEAAEERLDRTRALLRNQSRSFRRHTVEGTALHKLPARAALQRMDAIRWLHRVAYHLWRILHHLHRGETQAPIAAKLAEQNLDINED